MPDQDLPLTMTDVTDASLNAAVRLLLDSQYTKITITVQDATKKLYTITAE